MIVYILTKEEVNSVDAPHDYCINEILGVYSSKEDAIKALKKAVKYSKVHIPPPYEENNSIDWGYRDGDCDFWFYRNNKEMCYSLIYDIKPYNVLTI